MEYEVHVDFGDNAVSHPPKRCANLTELALYLERIPSMVGFEINRGATVKIERIYNKNPHIFQHTFDGLTV